MLKVTHSKFRFISLKVVLFTLVPYLSAYLIEGWVTNSMAIQPVADSVFNLRAVYQWLITAGPRELRPNYTILVDINPETDAEYKKLATEPGNPCGDKGTRNALALILKKIAEQNPAEIVIDKFFIVACEDEDPGTKNLKSMLESISEKTPIVIGRFGPYNADDSDHTEHGQAAPILEDSQPALTFPQQPIEQPIDKSKPRIIEGIVNLDLDNRKMALKWWAQRNNSPSPEYIPTLSFAAVKTYYETQSAQPTTESSEIKKLLKRDRNPYISFIERAKFDSVTIPAGKLIASDPMQNLSRLRGKIVIIGELDNQYDKHDSVFYSKIPGVILQANYIEAMLDQRCYEPIRWLDYVIGFLVFAAVYFCGLTTDSVLKLLIRLSLLLSGVFLLIYLPIVLFGFYISPITISSLGILIIITHRFFPTIKRKRKISKNNNQRLIK